MNLFLLAVGGASHRVSAVSFTLVICLAISPGCSKKKLEDIANQVQAKGKDLVKESKKMTDSLVKEAEAVLPESGNMTIQTPETIEIDQAVIKMHVVGDGRMNSLQITSYPPGTEYPPAPAVFLQATTAIETVALLAGKSVPCNFFIDRQSGAAIARNEIGQPVSVTFGSMNMQEKTITATIEACRLVGSDNEPLVIGGGKILAVVQETE
jgi:hypothetical protein